MPDLDELAFQLAGIAAYMRDVSGEPGLPRALGRAIGKAVDPVDQEVHTALAPHMPDNYANDVNADLRVWRRTFTNPDGAQVTVYASAGNRKLRRLDDGILWHPLFGRFPRRDPRNRWFEMGEPHVLPGFFTDTVEAAAPRVRAEIVKALDEVVRGAVRRR